MNKHFWIYLNRPYCQVVDRTQPQMTTTPEGSIKMAHVLPATRTVTKSTSGRSSGTSAAIGSPTSTRWCSRMTSIAPRGSWRGGVAAEYPAGSGVASNRGMMLPRPRTIRAAEADSSPAQGGLHHRLLAGLLQQLRPLGWAEEDEPAHAVCCRGAKSPFLDCRGRSGLESRRWSGCEISVS